jgi:hypothetical protein
VRNDINFFLANRREGYPLIQLLEKFIDLPSIAKGSLVYALFKYAFTEKHREVLAMNTLCKYLLIAKSATNFFNAENDPQSTTSVINFLGTLKPPAETVVTYLAAAKQYGFEKNAQITPANAVIALFSNLTVEQLSQLSK